MKKRFYFSLLFFVFLIIFFYTVNDNYFFNNSIRKEKEQLKSMNISAFLVSKYKDSMNHNFNTILLKDINTGIESKIYIIHESGRFYYMTNVGDTIKKEPGTLIINNITQKRIDTLKYLFIN
jgi:hypothetical protein